MYQYRNLPPRHQAPGFYPPHQPSLRTHNPNSSHSQTPHTHNGHTLHPIDDQHSHTPNGHSHSHNPSHGHPLTRSHSHSGLVPRNRHSPPPNHIHSHSQSPPRNGYRTHHIIPPQRNGVNPSTVANPPKPDAFYALQQMQRIKAATACQIINSRVVEAIRLQNVKKQQEKILKKKLYPNWKDPNETNPNNPAYKGAHNAKLLKQHKKGRSTHCDESDCSEDNADENAELTENDKMMTIPQLEISTAPKSTANITNLTDEELKMNPELYKMYSYYIPFAHSNNRHVHHTSPHNSTMSTRSQSLPPTSPQSDTRVGTSTQTHTSPHKPHISTHSHHHHRTNMGPRRRNPNFLKPQYNMGSDEDTQVASVSNGSNGSHSQSVSPQRVHTTQAKLVPIGKVKPNPLERIQSIPTKPTNKRKQYEPHMAPAHANVQSVISPNGGIYHPCHGYSTRDISIFDLFPGIVKYQSKKYAECDRVDYLIRLSEKSFCSVNNRPLKIDESEMWYTALKYLFNDITLGQFDYMSAEMRYVIKQYMSTHKNRLSFLNSIKNYGFLRVISDISKKLPVERIQKIIKAEKEKKEREQLLQMYRGHHQQMYRVPVAQHIPPQYINVQHVNPVHSNGGNPRGHYADWYNGNRLKRTISEPTPVRRTHISMMNKPTIIDEDEDNEDIDDSWNFITEIVNNSKIDGKMEIPDLPPENDCIQEKSESEGSNGEGMVDESEVYKMLYQSMKAKRADTAGKERAEAETEETVSEKGNDISANDNGPNISLSALTNINDHISDQFVPKLPFKWANKSNSSSIWIDNPYAKPAKYFSKKSIYKRKVQRK